MCFIATIGSLLFCQMGLSELTDEQITKLISRLQGKAEQETRTLHGRMGTTYAAPSTVQAPHVPFTHRVWGGKGPTGPKSRITVKSPKMTNPKGCKCFPHCECKGQCGENCTCIFGNVQKKVITSELN
jgi:hypothetical protein